ncbi:MAG: nucleoside-diphosphate sugar epimerase/dehydratase [Polyangiaceae bacterium]
MSRVVPKALRMLLDIIALAAMYVLAFLLRFDWHIPSDMMHRCIFVLPYAIALKYAVLYLFDVPKFAWRYIGLRETLQIGKALATSSAVLFAVRLAAPPLSKKLPILWDMIVPMGTLAMDAVLAFCAIVGLRSLWRITVEHQGKRRHVAAREANGQSKRTLLVGAGDAGLLVVKEAEARPDLGIVPVGFVDDDATKVGTMVHGVPVVAQTDQLVATCTRLNVEQVLLTVADAPGVAVRKLMKLCESANIPVKLIPQMSEIVDGRLNLSLRDVAIEDLLRREAAKLDETAIAGNIGGKVILVTGAGGSIGSELCRQLARVQPRKLVLVEQAENALFDIHRELLRTFPTLPIAPVIGDITDRTRMLAVFREHQPKVVLHAAAHKHVPMMEWNSGEAVKNNVFGTKCVADVARETGVERFVMISTDKAVNPTSVMGATKRVAELYIQAIGRETSASGGTRYTAVRFGNVLGSAGSVIPVFREQIARGGPVTVTHPEMRRYFMTIPEASQLVIQAASIGKGGEIFILDMGSPVLVKDLAEDLIRLSGLRPGEDIEIKFTGMRPGEKLFEELSVADEAAEKTYHPKIFVGRLPSQPSADFDTQLRALERAGVQGHDGDVRRRLQDLVPEFTPEKLEPAPESQSTVFAASSESASGRFSHVPSFEPAEAQG